MAASFIGVFCIPVIRHGHLAAYGKFSANTERNLLLFVRVENASIYTFIVSDITALRQNRLSNRIPELDGIRGIAITLVFFFHIQSLLFYGLNKSTLLKLIDRVVNSGWVGVDVFFVLSGYLITGILLKREPREYFWKVFYLRRAARILPAFIVVLSITLYFYRPQQLWVIVMYIFFIGNWTIVAGREIPPLGHLWSLAIEEQFYLIWPLVVRRVSNSTLLLVALSTAGISIALRLMLWAFSVNGYIVYKITPTRIDGLAIGAALAVAMTLDKPRAFLKRNYSKLFYLGLCLWVAGFFALKLSYFPWDTRSLLLASPAVSLMTVAAIFASIDAVLPSSVQSILANRTLVWIGQRSYGFYLIHEPVKAAAMYHTRHLYSHRVPLLLQNALLSVAVLIVSLILTEISWRLIESPSMRKGALWTEKIKQRNRTAAKLSATA